MTEDDTWEDCFSDIWEIASIDSQSKLDRRLKHLKSRIKTLESSGIDVSRLYEALENAREARDENVIRGDTSNIDSSYRGHYLR